ncbi:MAG: methylated-DNA--[protein]-cysteine S-methyltransferase [Gemmatimonadaceae bacterium]|nr:methylated-DNA--[protein]-cysteine S-methyltransferase [Gemmatimonadaceae bacterium]
MRKQTSQPADPALSIATGASPLGRILVATGEGGVAAVLLGDDDAEVRADLARRFPGVRLLPPGDAARRALAAVVAEIGSMASRRDVPVRDRDGVTVRWDERGDERGDERPYERKIPLDLRGTEFQRAVWTALRDIPRGSTATYSEIAARIGRPSAIRAVAQACASNAHAILIPCHRVVRSDGGLSGYRWGVERKRTLLREEGAVPR